MSRHRKFSAPLLVCMVCLLASVGVSRADDSSVTAIDVALEPDATMMQHAEAANARLREAYPKGYSLDASHQPHITMLQRFVNTSDLDKVYAAVGDVLAGEKPAEWTLEAYKYDFVVWSGLGLTVILVKATPDLIAFQQKLIDAVAPFTVETGTAAAFFTTPEEPDINQSTIDYVIHFVPDSSGEKLMPHVTVGVADPDFVKKWWPSRSIRSRSRRRQCRFISSAISERLGRNSTRGSSNHDPSAPTLTASPWAPLRYACSRSFSITSQSGERRNAAGHDDWSHRTSNPRGVTASLADRRHGLGVAPSRSPSGPDRSTARHGTTAPPSRRSSSSSMPPPRTAAPTSSRRRSGSPPSTRTARSGSSIRCTARWSTSSTAYRRWSRPSRSSPIRSRSRRCSPAISRPSPSCRRRTLKSSSWPRLTGMTVDEFRASATKWMAEARDHRWKRPYTDLTYQPMQEVLQYLRANGYKTYIVTGGGQDFVRPTPKRPMASRRSRWSAAPSERATAMTRTASRS